MNDNCKNILEKIAECQTVYEQGRQRQEAVWNHIKTARQPILINCVPGIEDIPDKELPYDQIYYDRDLMLESELRNALGARLGCGDSVPSIRANMGCGIFATILGVKQELFSDKMPWVTKHLSKSEILSKLSGKLTLSDDFLRALEYIDYFADAVKGSGCRIYPVDLQGAFDVAHLVLGDSIFLELYDDPAFIHDLLSLCCEAIFLGMDECLKHIPGSEQTVCHYNGLAMPRAKGGIKISEDTSTLLNPEHIQEFVIPYTDRILRHYNGGYVHYCGRNDHLMDELLKLDNLCGLNLGQPEKHDMINVLTRCAKNNIIYYGCVNDKPENMTYKSYFSELIKASVSTEGRSNLILHVYCNKENRDEILEGWEEAHDL